MSDSYVEDVPSKAPAFEFNLVAQALTPLLVRKSDNAVVLGIHGPWGSGKTTLMGAVRSDIESGPYKEQSAFIEFNAWKFQDRQALWRALILQMLGQLRLHMEAEAKKEKDAKQLAEINKSLASLEELQQSLYRAFAVEEKGPWTVNWRSLIVELIGIVLSALKIPFVSGAIRKTTGWFGGIFFSGSDKEEAPEALIDKTRIDELGKVLERTTIERNVVQVQSVEQFLTKFKELVDGFTKGNRRVFVFIDDLDRCLPESALEIFESIKLFLDAPGCAYIVALDRDVIRKALAARYSRPGEAALGQTFISADQYIEKTISISFDLPRLSDDDALELIDGFALPVALDAGNKQLIISGLGTNPRRVKRFMNTLAVQLNLAQIVKASGRHVDASLLAGGDARSLDIFIKLLVISYRYSGVFSLALEDKGLLGRLQSSSTLYQPRKRDGKAREDRNKGLANELSLVGALQYDEEFWDLMGTQPDLNKSLATLDQLRNWFRSKAPI